MAEAEAGQWPVRLIGTGEEPVVELLTAAHPLNPKIHTAEQDAVVGASLKGSGWLRRILKNVVTGRILDGHERIKLAYAAGQKTAPVDYCEVAEDDEPGVLLTLDPSGQLYRMHAEHWAKLQARTTASTDGVLRDFWARLAVVEGRREDREGDTSRPPGGSAGLEAVEEQEARGTQLQRQWQTAPGQVWSLGPHVVVCGDALSPSAWEQLRWHVGSVRGCLTSPPYAEQRAGAYQSVPAGRYVAWFRPLAGQLRAVLAADGSFFLNLKEHSEAIVRPTYVHALVVALVDDGWVYLDEFCWERAGVPGDPRKMGKFKNQWEPVFWFAKTPRPLFHPERVQHRSEAAFVDQDWHRTLGLYQGSGRDMLGPKARRGEGMAYPGNRLPSFGTAQALGQPAAFPVGLPRFFVDVYSEVGDWWVDPFGGSGSTLMACQELGRQCWLIEQSPAYVAITLERFKDFTGIEPVQQE